MTFCVCIFVCVHMYVVFNLKNIGTSQELDGLSVTERITARRKERYTLRMKLFIYLFICTEASQCCHLKCIQCSVVVLVLLAFKAILKLAHCLRKLVLNHAVYRLTSV